MAVLYQYYKKEINANKILVRINPATMEGLELLISSAGQIEQNKRDFDATIYDDLDFDGFASVNPMEFNLYLSGAAK